MKKIITSFVFFIMMMSFCIPVYAAHGDEPIYTGTVVEIEYLDNGDYIETVIEDDSIIIPGDSTMATTVTKTKAKNYKNSAGNILWSIKVQGTFTYNGTSATCTKSEYKATSYAATWSIISASSSKSGNTATATATARHHLTTGYHDYTRSVTLTCSPTGVFT